MKTIEEKADEFAFREYEVNKEDYEALHKGYYHGAKEALASQWRSAEEKPEHMTVAVVSDRYDDFYVAVYNKIYNQWCSAETQKEIEVKYWMPIPENPKLLQQ